MKTVEELRLRYRNLIKHTETNWGVDCSGYFEAVVKEELVRQMEDRIAGVIEGLTVPELLAMLDIAQEKEPTAASLAPPETVKKKRKSSKPQH